MWLFRAVGLAWEYRDLGAGRVDRISLPVSDQETSSGAMVVCAEALLKELLAEALEEDKSDLDGCS